MKPREVFTPNRVGTYTPASLKREKSTDFSETSHATRDDSVALREQPPASADGAKREKEREKVRGGREEERDARKERDEEGCERPEGGTAESAVRPGVDPLM